MKASMRFIRRHLAACGLAVALFQSALQAVLPVGLCCSTPPAETTAPKAHCCTAQSDADGTCPMHRRASHHAAGTTQSDCRLVCTSHGEHALFSVSLAGPLPRVVTAIASRSDVGAAVVSEQHAASLAPELHTPPPRA